MNYNVPQSTVDGQRDFTYLPTQYLEGSTSPVASLAAQYGMTPAQLASFVSPNSSIYDTNYSGTSAPSMLSDASMTTNNPGVTLQGAIGMHGGYDQQIGDVANRIYGTLSGLTEPLVPGITNSLRARGGAVARGEGGGPPPRTQT